MTKKIEVEIGNQKYMISEVRVQMRVLEEEIKLRSGFQRILELLQKDVREPEDLKD